jgi:hypothetical protein
MTYTYHQHNILLSEVVLMKLDRTKADLLSQTPKVIVEDVFWQGTKRGYDLSVEVIATDIGEILKLCAKIGKDNRSFTLLYRNLPIRRYCAQGGHTPPRGKRIHGHHKHTWDEVMRDRFIYVPDDIDEGVDVNIQLFQFMREQNIECLGDYQRLMI